MPRTKNTDARREEIVLGLMRVLAERGYAGATIAEIARAAGITSPGLVHYHFGSKQEILLALGAHLVAAIDARVVPHDEPLAKLHEWIRAHLALGPSADPEALACWVAIGSEALVQPEVGELYRSVLDERRAALLKMLREVRRAEGKSTRGLTQLATTVLATVEGYYQLGSAAPELVPRGRAAAAVIALVDRALEEEV